MVSKKFQNRLLVVLLIITLLLLGVSVKFYFDQLSFLKGVDGVYKLDPKTNRKIVYYNNGGATDIFIAKDDLNKLTAVKVSTVPAIDPPIVENVIFYDRNYVVIPYAIGEGYNEFLIFDETGKIITDRLLEENQSSLTSGSYPNEILDLREDGSLTLREYNSNIRAIFDITTGKFKDYEE